MNHRRSPVVVFFMIEPGTRPRAPADTGVVVRGPRPADTLGPALRGAFAAPPTLPDDMLRALDRLDHGAAPWITGRG